MAVSKRFKYTDENGASVSVDLGANAENVDVNGTPLTEVLAGLSGGAPICYGTCSTSRTNPKKIITTTNGNFKFETGAIVVVRPETVIEPLNDLTTFKIDGTAAYDFCPRKTTTCSTADYGTDEYIASDQVFIIAVCADIDEEPSFYALVDGLKPGASLSAEDKTNLDGMTVYSTTPQRVGTWIDGTPVWRAAFNHSISDDDRMDSVVSLPNFVTDRNNMFVLDAKIYLSYNAAPSVVDDAPLDYNGMMFSVEDSRISAKSGNEYLYYGCYGRYKFVTPESNTS